MFGSHLSISGGMHNALLAAEKFGMECVQVFTKNQKQWQCAPLSEETVKEWKAHSKRLDFAHTVSHDSYLINLASPDETMWRKSIALFVEEITRCDALGIPYLVTHPGAHMGKGEEVGISRIVEGLDIVFATIGKPKGVTVCLEATAGQGSSIGHQLEHLAAIMEKVKTPKRFGVCLDTAHLFAAGYDFRGKKYDAFRKQLDKTVGVSRVKVLHLNDSKKELGSRVDRHEHIGQGHIGIDGFIPWVQDEAFKNVPKILETEKGTCPDTGRDWDAINLEVLRKLV